MVRLVEAVTTAEAVFLPRPGQVDYTHIRYAPVLNAVVVYLGKVLLLQRSNEMRSYPNHWCGISGYLDDDRCVEDKTRQEMLEDCPCCPAPTRSSPSTATSSTGTDCRLSVRQAASK